MTIQVELREGNFTDGTPSAMVWVTDLATGNTFSLNTEENPLEAGFSGRKLADVLHYYAVCKTLDLLEALDGDVPLMVAMRPNPSNRVSILPVSGPILTRVLEHPDFPDYARESHERYVSRFNEATPVLLATFEGSFDDDVLELQERGEGELKGYVEHSTTIQ